jgi:hypothetical protein
MVSFSYIQSLNLRPLRYGESRLAPEAGVYDQDKYKARIRNVVGILEKTEREIGQEGMDHSGGSAEKTDAAISRCIHRLRLMTARADKVIFRGDVDPVVQLRGGSSHEFQGFLFNTIRALEQWSEVQRIDRTVDRALCILSRAVEDISTLIIDAKMPEARSLSALSIGSYGMLEGMLDDAALRQMVALNSELEIANPKAMIPQNGFLRGLKKEGWDNELVHSDRHVVTLRDKKLGSISGYGLLKTDPKTLLPEYQRAAAKVAELIGSKEGGERRYGWLDVVGIARSARRVETNEGSERAYDYMATALINVGRDLGLTDILCVVRGGAQANTAIEAHKRVGFIDTGVVVDHITGYGDVLCHVLRLPLVEVPSSMRFGDLLAIPDALCSFKCN